jgi:hypothetical protein
MGCGKKTNSSTCLSNNEEYLNNNTAPQGEHSIEEELQTKNKQKKRAIDKKIWPFGRIFTA